MKCAPWPAGPAVFLIQCIGILDFTTDVIDVIWIIAEKKTKIGFP